MREHDGWGLRQADLIASCEQIAFDIARLTGIGDGDRSVVLLLDDPTNATALPAMSFAPIRFQLVSGLARACEARGFRVVRASDPDAASADYSVLSGVRGTPHVGGAFVVDYLVAEGSRTAEPGGALIDPVRAAVQ